VGESSENAWGGGGWEMFSEGGKDLSTCESTSSEGGEVPDVQIIPEEGNLRWS